MPVSDFICPDCETVHANVYVALDDFDNFVETCECGAVMDYDLRRKLKRSTRGIKFREFTLHHTKRLDGSPEGREIHSLADIRRFEKEHEDQNVCVEAFSYDTEAHVPEPQSQAPPRRLTDSEKRDFLEKVRAMNIKSERTAKEYDPEE